MGAGGVADVNECVGGRRRAGFEEIKCVCVCLLFLSGSCFKCLPCACVCVCVHACACEDIGGVTSD